MIYEVSIHIEGFEGSIDLLVQQVRRYEVDIIDVMVSNVAKQVADQMSSRIDLQFFSPFLTVSKLMFLKSRNLLPGQNQFDETDLEEQVKDDVVDEETETQVRIKLERQYGSFKEIGTHLSELFDENTKKIRSYQTRSGLLPGFIDEIAYLEEISPFDLMVTLNHLIARSLVDDTYHVRSDDAQMLNNRISQIFDFVVSRRGQTVTFVDVAGEKRDRHEIALSFLALVYLVSQGKIVARQHTPYGEITIYLKYSSSDRRELNYDDSE